MSVAETYNSFKCVGMVYTSSSEHGTTSGCEVQLSNASSYQQPELIPGHSGSPAGIKPNIA